MSIYYKSTKVLPYVYRLDNPITGEFYIGFRAANKVPSSDDLGEYYFTSSPYVQSDFSKFELTILAEFFDADSAFKFEQETIKNNFHIYGILNKRYIDASKSKNKVQEIAKVIRNQTKLSKNIKILQKFKN